MSTKFLIGHGTQDPVVLPEFVPEMKDLLGKQSLTVNTYPMGHSSSMEEIGDLTEFLQSIFA